MSGTDSDMVENNRQVQMNWGTFNVPTIALLLTVGGMVWNLSGTQANQNARIEAIELQRSARSAEVNKALEALQQRIMPMTNLEYRVTVLEAGIGDVNRRIDRVSDSIQVIRDDIGILSTKFEVLAEQVRAALPFKKALTTPPIEFRTRGPSDG